MKNKSRTLKLIFDVFILALLALMYRKNAISMRFHEWGGLALCCLFLAHKLFNRKWIVRVTAGIFRGKVRLNGLWIVDVLLLIAMTGVLVTGLFISKTLPTALRNGFRLQTWHYFAAAMSLALTGVHLGLHWPLLRTAVWDRLPRGRVRTAAGIVLLAAILGFGGYFAATTSTVSWFTRPFMTMNAGSRMRSGGQDGFRGGDRAGRQSPDRTPGSPADEMPELPAEGTPEFPAEGMPELPAESKTENGQAREPGNRQAGAGNGMGAGRRDGSGNGMGANMGKMKAQQGSGALRTALTFTSVILLFAAVTALIRAGIGKLKRRRAERAAAR